MYYISIIEHTGPGNSVGIATGYGLDDPGLESRWGRDFPHLSRPALGPTQPPVQWVPGLSRGKERPGRDADPTPPNSAVVKKEYSYTFTPPMGRTTCTEPQRLYNGALYPYLYFVCSTKKFWRPRPPPHLLSETTVFGGFSQNLQTKVWYILQFGLLPATIDAYVERNLHGHCPHLSVEFGETCHSTSPRNAIDSMRVTLKL